MTDQPNEGTRPTSDAVVARTTAITLIVAEAVAALLEDKPMENQERENRLAAIRRASAELFTVMEATQPGSTERLAPGLPALFPDRSA